MPVSCKDMAVVQGLADQVAEIAGSDAMEARRQLWRDTYMLRDTDRAPVWFNGSPRYWGAIVDASQLQCEDRLARMMEHQLRILLEHHSYGDDFIIAPYWKVPAAISVEQPPLWGVEVKRQHASEVGASWTLEPPIQDESDLEKLRMPSWRHDAEETERRLSRHAEILGEAMPVRLNATLPIFPGVARNASDLVGLEGLLVNMALEPEFMHRLMAFLRDSVLHCIDQMEEMGIFTENNDEHIHFSESIRTTPVGQPLRASDLWLRTESQQFERVSPGMWREFCLEYQKPIMARFRYVSYGCCENLTDRIDDVLAIPNLRIFVNGPWTDWGNTVEKCADRYALVWRQHAAKVLTSPDLDTIERDLRAGLAQSRGCHRGVVLQEIDTSNGNPQRLRDWVGMAVKASEEVGY